MELARQEQSLKTHNVPVGKDGISEPIIVRKVLDNYYQLKNILFWQSLSPKKYEALEM